MNKSIMVATMLAALIPGLAIAGDSPAPDNAKAYFIWPKNGTTIKGAIIKPLRAYVRAGSWRGLAPVVQIAPVDKLPDRRRSPQRYRCP